MSPPWTAASASLAILVTHLGCAYPFIEATTVLDDTTDSLGPYSVAAVVVATRESDRVEVRYSAAEAEETIVGMREVGDDGDGQGHHRVGEIPGHPVGTEIGYYVVIVRDGDIVDRDPTGETGTDPRFTFMVVP